MPRIRNRKADAATGDGRGAKWGVLLLSWLIPGWGFWRHGLKGRAVLFFVVLQSVFLIGAALQGSVLMPEFSPRSEGFNLVTILTFVVQMFNGLLGLISLLPDLAGSKYAILPYNETHALAELGSFYLLVSGGMNYFVLASTHDHFYGSKAENAEAGRSDALRADGKQVRP